MISDSPNIKTSYEHNVSIPAPQIVFQPRLFPQMMDFSDCLFYKFLNVTESETDYKNCKVIKGSEGLLPIYYLSLNESLVNYIVLNLQTNYDDGVYVAITINKTIDELINYELDNSFGRQINETYKDALPIDLSNNLYYIYPNTNVDIYFRFIKRMTLKDSILAKLGLPIYQEVNYIVSRSNIQYNPKYNNTVLFTFNLETTDVEVETEKRDHTIIDVIGTLAAIYGLITAIYIFLFQKELGDNEPYGLIKRLPFFGGESKPIREMLQDPLPTDLEKNLKKLNDRISKLEKFIEN
ncbi:hypothetical protein F8M41_000972 [Gigaspora margarita]|uniref:Uncharacterized protein n=1 Tax=Gigaspora margarita TaxID=4874 RepID=A0A8H3XGM1_GIGMA|nr:hypothetical protein F8M41_000972 [Gigaspora margarita]